MITTVVLVGAIQVKLVRNSVGLLSYLFLECTLRGTTETVFGHQQHLGLHHDA